MERFNRKEQSLTLVWVSEMVKYHYSEAMWLILDYVDAYDMEIGVAFDGWDLKLT